MFVKRVKRSINLPWNITAEREYLSILNANKNTHKTTVAWIFSKFFDKEIHNLLKAILADKKVNFTLTNKAKIGYIFIVQALLT